MKRRDCNKWLNRAARDYQRALECLQRPISLADARKYVLSLGMAVRRVTS